MSCEYRVKVASILGRGNIDIYISSSGMGIKQIRGGNDSTAVGLSIFFQTRIRDGSMREGKDINVLAEGEG